MTSTTTGLPDRYRPLDQVGPDEQTPTGVIRSWRAHDRVLNRDVAIRVHTPAGPAAQEWITRALTAGGLATPALAMVYDAAEGTGGPSPAAPPTSSTSGSRATRLSDRLATDGPLPEREARSLVRRLAEGVAEAHRVGLAVGGLTPEHVVLRPGGLVGLLSVPARQRHREGRHRRPGRAARAVPHRVPPRRRRRRPPVIASPDLHGPGPPGPLRPTRPPGCPASARWSRCSPSAPRPGAGPAPARRTPSGPTATPTAAGCAGCASAARHRRPAAADADPDGPVRLGRATLPPVPGARPAPASAPPRPGRRRRGGPDWGGTFDRRTTTPGRRPAAADHARAAGSPSSACRCWRWPWSSPSPLVRQQRARPSPATSTDVQGPPRPASAASSSAAGPPPSASAPAAGAAVPIAARQVFDPFGDGEPENDDDVPRTFDGDPVHRLVHARATAARRTSATSSPASACSTTWAATQSLAGVTHHHHAARRHRGGPHRRHRRRQPGRLRRGRRRPRSTAPTT